MRDYSDDLAALGQRLTEARPTSRSTTRGARLGELEVEIGKPDLWDDQDRAKAVNSEYASLRDDVETFDSFSRRLEDTECCT